MAPWWHFAEMFRAPPLEADIVICDAALGEMDVFAARYVVRLTKTFLEESPVGLFLYKNLGEQRQNTTASINHLFAGVNGYRTFSCGPVTAHCANDALPNELFTSLASGPPPISQGEGEELSSAEEFFDAKSPRLLESYAFFDYLRLNV